MVCSCRVKQELCLDPERPEYHRAVVQWGAVSAPSSTTSNSNSTSSNGPDNRPDAAVPKLALTARSTGSQMSCRLLSMRGANALLCLPARAGSLPAHSSVPALLIGDILPPEAEHCYHRKAAQGDLPAAVKSTVEVSSVDIRTKHR